MAEFNLDDFMGSYGDLARSYLFYARITTNPVGWNRDFVYLVRSASLPTRTIEAMEVPWQGNLYKLASTSTFAEMTIEFNVDIDSNVRQSLLDWSNLIHNPETNAHGNPNLYMGRIELEHLNGEGSTISKFILVKCWPSEVGEIALAYDSKEIANFSTTWQYQYFIEG